MTGLIKLGGEIIEGSNGGRVPGLDCFLRELRELDALERFGKVGCAFLLLDDEDMLGMPSFIVRVDVELLADSAGVFGRVVAGVRAATGGGGGREYLGGVDAGR